MKKTCVCSLNGSMNDAAIKDPNILLTLSLAFCFGSTYLRRDPHNGARRGDAIFGIPLLTIVNEIK